MGYLIDTNVLAELRKGPRANSNVSAWFNAIEDDNLYLSVLVAAEIRRGIENIHRRDPAAATSLESWLSTLL